MPDPIETPDQLMSVDPGPEAAPAPAPAPAGEVRIALRDGRVAVFPTPEQAQAFVQARPDVVLGLDTPELQEQRRLREAMSTPGMQVAGTVFRAGNSLLGGIPEAIGRATDPESAAALDAFDEANPTLSGTADLGGMAVGGVLGANAIRGAGLGARVLPTAGIASVAEAGGAAVTRRIAGNAPGLARRILARTGGLAAEGAIDATGYAGLGLATEAALGNPRLTAEQTIAELGREAFIGGTFGSAIGLGWGGATLGRHAVGRTGEAIAASFEARFGVPMHGGVARALAGGGDEGQILADLRAGGARSEQLLSWIEGGESGLDADAARIQQLMDGFQQDAGHVEDFGRGQLRREHVQRRVQTSPVRLLEQVALHTDQLARARALAQQLETDSIYNQAGRARGRELLALVTRYESELQESLEQLGALNRMGDALPDNSSPALMPAGGDTLVGAAPRRIEAGTNPGGRRVGGLDDTIEAVGGRADTVIADTVADPTLVSADPRPPRGARAPDRARMDTVVDGPVTSIGDIAPEPSTITVRPGWLENVTLGNGADEITEATARQVAADMFIRLDHLKRQVGQLARAAEGSDSEAFSAFQGLHAQIREPLMDSVMWGDELATMQREVNAAWTAYISEADTFNTGFTSDGPRDPANPWRRMRQADLGKIRAFLGVHGVAKGEKRLRVFRTVLEARARLSATIAKHMDLPPDLAAAAQSAPRRIREMEKVLAEVSERATAINQFRAAMNDDKRFRGASGALMGAAQVSAFAGVGPLAGLFGTGAVIAGARSNRANASRMIAQLRRFAGKQDLKLGEAVDGLLHGTVRGVSVATRAGLVAGPGFERQYRERLAELDRDADMSTTAQRLADMTRGLEGAPQVRQQIQVSMVRAAYFLQSVRPRPRILPGTLIPDRNALPQRAEMERFMRYARATDNPGTVLDDMRAGVVTAEGAHALRTVYPGMYAAIVQRIMEQLSDPDGVPPTFQRRIQLARLLGTPTDPSLTPAFLATIQGAHSQLGMTQGPVQQRGSSPAPQIAKGAASDSDRLVARRSAQ